VTIEPTTQERVYPGQSPERAGQGDGLRYAFPFCLGRQRAFQYGVISGPLASALMIGSFSTFLLLLGNDPRIVSGEARTLEIQHAEPAKVNLADDSETEPQADEVLHLSRTH